MHSSNWKRLVLIGFIAILLVAIPVALYLVKQTTNTASHATPATNLTFTPPSSNPAPITANVGDTVPLTLNIDPGTNLVTSVKVYIQYDPTKLSASSTSFTVNNSAFPVTVDGPTYSPGSISFSVSIGADYTKAIQSPTSVGTLTFTALAATNPNTPTQVSVTTQSQVLSAGPNDQYPENVLLSRPIAYIAVNGPAQPSLTPTGVPGPTATPIPGQPTNTPTPTLEATPTSTPAATPVAIATPTTAVVAVIANPTDTPVPPLPSATIAATGSTDITFGAGAILTVLSVIGGVIFFVL